MRLRTATAAVGAGARDHWVTIQTRPDESTADSGFPTDAPWTDFAVVAMAREITNEEFVLLTTIGTMLAPALIHAEHSRHLETEVALRTRQIEQQRRFTERIISCGSCCPASM